MKRVAALVLATVWLGPTTHAADPAFAPQPLVPTSPQVPAPRLEGAVVPAAGLGERALLPLRERIALAIAPSLSAPASLPSVMTPALPSPIGYSSLLGDSCTDGSCGRSGRNRACWNRLKAWLCFSPTTGDALPKLRPAPYVGSLSAFFRCESGGGCAGGATGCGGAIGGSGGLGCDGRRGLLDGSGRLGGGLLGRGCKGECVSPSELAFPGYKFASPESAAALKRPLASGVVTSTSYKPSGEANPAPANAPSKLDPLVRPLSQR
jgi:hypothetical protein